MVRTMRWLTIAAVLLVAASCVRYYKSSDLRKSFAKAERQVDKLVSKADEDLTKRKAALKKARKKGVELDGPAGREMQEVMGRMAGLRSEMAALGPRVSGLADRLAAVLGKSRKISEKDRRFSKVQGLIDELKEVQSVGNRLVAEYKKLHRQFMKKAKSLGR